MNAQNAGLKSTAAVEQRIEFTARRIIAPVLAAMMFVLLGLISARYSVSAAGPSGPPPNSISTPAPAADCNGRLDVPYYPLLLAPVPTTFPSAYPSTLATNGLVTLQGYLYLPGNSSIYDSPKNLPVIVYNHGSGQEVNQVCEMAHYFMNHGFAFFVPHWRGHGLSTGTHHVDYLDQVCNRTAANPMGSCSKILQNDYTLKYLDDHTFENARAIEYLLWIRNRFDEPVINPNKIAIIGHSFGAIATLFANARLSSHKCAVSIAGASQSWDSYDAENSNPHDDSSPSINILKRAVRGANKPIFFFEPKNDVSIRPTIILSKEAGDNEDRFQATIYAPVPEDLGDPHVQFVMDRKQVEKWGAAVLEFLARFGVK